MIKAYKVHGTYVPHAEEAASDLEKNGKTVINVQFCGDVDNPYFIIWYRIKE